MPGGHKDYFVSAVNEKTASQKPLRNTFSLGDSDYRYDAIIWVKCIRHGYDDNCQRGKKYTRRYTQQLIPHWIPVICSTKFPA